mgnify:CR=1 FL=1
MKIKNLIELLNAIEDKEKNIIITVPRPDIDHNMNDFVSFWPADIKIEYSENGDLILGNINRGATNMIKDGKTLDTGGGGNGFRKLKDISVIIDENGERKVI